MYKLVKKTLEKEGKKYVNVYLITTSGVKIPVEVKRFGKKKQDYFRQCSLEEEAEEVK